MSERYDAIIIGAGIIGSAVALACVEPIRAELMTLKIDQQCDFGHCVRTLLPR